MRQETPDARRRRIIYLEKQKAEAEAAVVRLRAEQVEKQFEIERRRSLKSRLTHSLGDALRAKGIGT